MKNPRLVNIEGINPYEHSQSLYWEGRIGLGELGDDRVRLLNSGELPDECLPSDMIREEFRSREGYWLWLAENGLAGEEESPIDVAHARQVRGWKRAGLCEECGCGEFQNDHPEVVRGERRAEWHEGIWEFCSQCGAKHDRGPSVVTVSAVRCECCGEVLRERAADSSDRLEHGGVEYRYCSNCGVDSSYALDPYGTSKDFADWRLR